jgi:hypothetical protein
MKFTMLIYEGAEDWAARTDEAKKEQYWTGWRVFTQSMMDAGILAYPGNILQPGATGHTIRLAGGQIQARGGAYTDLPEQLSGFYVLDVSDVSVAKEWASRAPSVARGAVEIRPVL